MVEYCISATIIHVQIMYTLAYNILYYVIIVYSIILMMFFMFIVNKSVKWFKLFTIY